MKRMFASLFGFAALALCVATSSALSISPVAAAPIGSVLAAPIETTASYFGAGQLVPSSETTASVTLAALTPQREKFKSCAAGWSAYKTANTVTGRKAYDTYMAGCLKKPT